MNGTSRFVLTAICSAISSSAWCQAGAAAPRSSGDGGIQTVIVTATKRAQGVRDVPQSIDAFSQTMLEDMGARDISDVVKGSVGVELRSGQPGLGGVAIRGVSELNLFNLNGGTGSATGLYLDELPLTAAGLFPELNAFDLERVEVLKGPQGTLFGEGSLAGTVRLITVKPDLRRFGAAASADVSSTRNGDRNHLLNGVVNIPLSRDVAALRVTVFDREDSGWVDTKLSSSQTVVRDTNGNQSRGGRLLLRLRPTKGQTLDLSASTSDSTRGGTSLASDDLIGLKSILESSRDKVDTANLTWQLDGNGVQYLATASKMKRDLRRNTDQLGLVRLTNTLYSAFGLPLVQGQYAPQDVTTDTTAVELRAVSTAPGPLQWTAGVFYKSHAFSYRLTSESEPVTAPAVYSLISRMLSGGRYDDDFAILADTQAKTEQAALFGELAYDLSPALQVQGGLRLFEERRESRTRYGGVILYVPAAFGGPITPPGTAETSATDRVVNPRLTVSYKLAPGWLGYGSMARGFRSGGQNDLFFSVPGGKPTYEPETLTSFELGLKTEHLNRRLFVDLSLFSLQWRDLQAVVGEGPGGAGEIIGNVGQARSNGLELSLRARPMPELEFQAGVSYVDAKTRSALSLPESTGTGFIEVPVGARIPGTARHTANLAATYRPSLGDTLNGMLRLGVTSVGDSISQIYNQDSTAPGYTTLDLKLGVEGQGWSAHAYASNLTDAKVRLFRHPNDNPETGAPQYFWGRPRTVGISVRFDLP